jgi:cell division protein FtsA
MEQASKIYIAGHRGMVGSGLERKLNAGIVITGGGSQLKHLDKLVEFVTGIDTRIGYPNEHISKTIVEEIKSPMYATGVGLVIKGLNGEEEVTVETTQEEETSQVATNKKGGFLSTWLEKGKAWLNEDDIKDF